MDDTKLRRINELARLKKTRGLTEEEQAEQDALRREYIDSIRNNLRSQLDHIDILKEDGTIENLGEKHGKKRNQNSD